MFGHKATEVYKRIHRVSRKQTRKGVYVSIDLHEVALAVILAASVLSLLLLVAKALAKEFEDAAVVWIRAFKRIRAELHAPSATEPSQTTTLDQSSIRRKLD